MLSENRPKERLVCKQKNRISLLEGRWIRPSGFFCKMEILRYEKSLSWPFSNEYPLILLFGPSLPSRDVSYYMEIDILAFGILVLELILANSVPTQQF